MRQYRIADLCDDNREKNIQVLPPKFNNYGGKKIFSGKVRTIQLNKSNYGLIELLKEENGKGKVLVVDVQGEFHGVFGDKLSHLAEKAQYEGLIINGYVRDVMETKKFNIGLYALGTCALRNFEESNSTHGMSLEFENTVFNENDYIYSDEDGIIISNEKLVS